MGAKVNEKHGIPASVKMSYVAKSLKLKGDELGTFLRKNGIYKEELEQWKEHMKSGLESEQKVSRQSKRFFRDKIKKLERELLEAQVIIETQKKVRDLMAEKVENTVQKIE